MNMLVVVGEEGSEEKREKDGRGDAMEVKRKERRGKLKR
jgi:hypothetical protein